MDTTPPPPPLSPTTTATAEPPPPPPKLRLMCSYGGHILPRPHDKTLTYVGGDTRIVSVDRRAATIPALLGHLAKTLHQNSPFTLRYQLPNEDLDSLISLTTQEDLDNMLEEHDRIVRSPNSNGRIRLFIFPSQNSAVDQQTLLETASMKSDDWFFNTINGKPTTPLSDRGFSESSSVNCLLGLEDDLSKVESSSNIREEENQKGLNNNNSSNNQLQQVNHKTISDSNINNQDVCSVPESPLKLETASSSFGSTSSSPVGLVNLPPIKVRVEGASQKGSSGTVEDQFQQMNLEGNLGNVTPLPPQLNDAVVQQLQHRVQPQLQQFQKSGAVFDLPSPDSVSSEGSFTNPQSRARHIVYQEPVIQIPSSKTIDQINPKVQIQESAFLLPSQYDPNHPQLHQTQNFVHANAQYIQSAGPVPIASYYPVYPSQQPHQPLLDHNNYPVYIVSARPPQSYNLPVQQPSYSELNAGSMNSTHPHMPNASNVTPHMGFTQSRNFQLPTGQNQGQYVAYTQNQHPSQSMAPLTNPVYGYEFADSANAGIYYTPLPPQLAAQYQLSPEASALSVENVKHPQVGNLQP